MKKIFIVPRLFWIPKHKLLGSEMFYGIIESDMILITERDPNVILALKYTFKGNSTTKSKLKVNLNGTYMGIVDSIE